MKNIIGSVFLSLSLLSAPLGAESAKEKSRSEQEVDIRQELIQVALAKKDADLIIRGATVLNAFTASWMKDQDIAVAILPDTHGPTTHRETRKDTNHHKRNTKHARHPRRT